MTKMGRSALVLALLGGVATLSTGAQAREDVSRAAAKAMPRLQASMNGNDCAGAMKAVSPVLSRKDFATLDQSMQARMLLAATLCEGGSNQLEPALVHARALTALPNSPNVAWRMRFGIELDSGRYGDAVTTLETMQRQFPAALEAIESRWVFDLAGRFKGREDDPAYRRLLTLAIDPKFAPAGDDRTYQSMRLPLARLLAKDGDTPGATAQIAAIRDANLLRDVSLDPMLRGFLPQPFDLRTAYERQADDLEKRSIARPGLLELPVSLAATQRTLGQTDKALATLEAARPEGVLAKQFADRNTHINWWWDGLARTYEQLGRYDQAVDAYRKAIDGGESGGANVSQTINLAYLHVRFGHPQDALTVLAPFTSASEQKTSPYGMMEFHLAHGCAAQALGQTEAVNADLTYAQDHAKDHPTAFTDLQLCTGRIDMAAASMIARLDNPEMRVDALAQLSLYRAPPTTLPADPFAAGMEALRNRADVQAAIARSGGIGHFDIYPTTL